ncbi:MAG: hypothetical protein ACKO96_22775 [Flammeovirgaceae bacterium]
MESPSLIDHFDEKRLRRMFAEHRYQNPLTYVKLVIVSACESSNLAKIFSDMGIPSVVSINSGYTIQELAAKTFNSWFL